MIRRPPRSTLFPYTRSSDLQTRGILRRVLRSRGIQRSGIETHIAGRAGRSEEHTSELQSQSNLVCRLLLEKKKKDTLNGAMNRRNTLTNPSAINTTYTVCDV